MPLDSLGREIAELFDDSAPEIGLEELDRSVVQGARGARARRPLLAALGGFASVLAAGALILNLTGGNQAEPTPVSQPDSISTTVQVGPTTSSSTGTSSTSIASAEELPVPVFDSNEPRPLDPDLTRSPDWTFLEPGPLSSRWPAVSLWTGEEIVIWGGETIAGSRALGGGAAFNPFLGTWREMSQEPFVPDEVEWVWTNSELIIWGTGRAMAWNPETNSWRVMEEWPLTGEVYRQAVWTGEEIIDVNAGLAVNPLTGASRLIADPPQLEERASVVWTGTHVVVVTGEGAYDPSSNTWIEMPESGLTDLSTSGSAVNGAVVAVDYEMGAARYDPVVNEWFSLPALPIRFFECGPEVHTVSGIPVVEHCGGWATLVEPDLGWMPFSSPTPLGFWTMISVDDDLYAWGGDGFAVLSNRAILEGGTPSRMAVGIGFLDLEQGWTVDQVIGHPPAFQGGDSTYDLRAPDGEPCVVTATHAGASGTLSQLVNDSTSVAELLPYVGGNPYRALENGAGSIDELHHLTWPVGTTDVIDVACPTSELAWALAGRIWTTRQ